MIKKNKYHILTIGGATCDITFYTNEGILIDNKKDLLRQKMIGFEYGAKIKISKTYNTFGGGAANAAVCFSRLGFCVASIVSVGNDDRGESIIKNFKKHKVETKFVQKIKAEETSFSFILVSSRYNNEHIVFSNRGANNRLVVSLKNSVAENVKWIYITSLSGEINHWRQNLENIFKIDKPKIAWNPGGRQIAGGIKVIGKYLKRVTVLIMNRDEALELATTSKYRKKTKEYLNNIKNLLKILYEFSPSIVVITCSSRGAYAYDGKKNYYQNTVKEKKRIDTTGVGDAFGSTFVAGLDIYSGDISKALQLASKNAASVIENVGAQNGLILN